MPKFTIAIPTHNNLLEDLINCLKSASDVEFDDYEVIISDTSDTDDNYNYLIKYIKENSLDNVTIQKNNSKWSMWDNHNYLAQNAKGDYIFFLHSDDTILPNALNGIDAILKGYRYPTRIIVAGCSIFKSYKTTLNELGLETNRIISGAELVELFTRGGLTPSGTLFSRDLNDIGGFIGDSMVLPYSDCWTELNCALHGFRLYISDDIFFIRDSNGTKMKYGSDEGVKDVYERIKIYFPEPLAMIVINSALKINSWVVLKHFTFDSKYKRYIMKSARLRLLFHPIKNRRIRRLFYWHGK